MQPEGQVELSIILCAMGRLELADYGFKSWMLQKTDQSYEVVLSLFNDQQPRFEQLAQGRNPNCRLIIKSYERPEFFNISVANNLGIHFSDARYVFIANADVIYPSDMADKLMRNVCARGISYAVTSRRNLSESQTKSLKPVGEFRSPGDFDFLEAWKDFESIWIGTNGWIARRQPLVEIGGFDPAVLHCEDLDLSDRLMHYLQRTRMQDCMVGVQLFGYHLYHGYSDIFEAYSAAQKILEPRRAALAANPQGALDQIESHLDSLPRLLEDLRQTRRPAVKNKKFTLKKFARRLNNAYGALRGRT